MNTGEHATTGDCPAVGTGRVRVRYVITGACPPAYSGRVVQTIVSLLQPDGSLTTVEMMMRQFFNSCSANMKGLVETMNGASVRILKAGCVLHDKAVLAQSLTDTERKECLAEANESVGDTTNEGLKPSVVMHMVIQGNRSPPAEIQIRAKKRLSSTLESSHVGEGPEAKKDSCCTVM